MLNLEKVEADGSRLARHPSGLDTAADLRAEVVRYVDPPVWGCGAKVRLPELQIRKVSPIANSNLHHFSGGAYSDNFSLFRFCTKAER